MRDETQTRAVGGDAVMGSEAESSTGPLIDAEIRYHVSVAARLAGLGHADEAASEALLAGALLAFRTDPADTTVSALPPADALEGDAEVPSTVGRRAHALALELQAHYTSEGQFELATVYEHAAGSLSTG